MSSTETTSWIAVFVMVSNIIMLSSACTSAATASVAGFHLLQVGWLAMDVF